MRESWPHVLAKLSGKNVYNLGMGGYGPNQYYHLLTTKGLQLKPKMVICGIYMGDDFDNAFRITYGFEHWSSLREGGLRNVDPDIWEKQDPGPRPTFQKRVRIWLSENSVMYKLVFHGLLQGIKGRVQIANATKIYPETTALILPEKGIQEAFRPKGVLRGLDQGSEGVQEGMRITLRLLREMNTICSTNNIKFIAAIIPTKESVFAHHLKTRENIEMAETLKAVIENERIARENLCRQFSEANIEFIDLLPHLVKAADSEQIYTFAATDMHPNRNGYRVIAEGLRERLGAIGSTNAAANP
jgi:hypothetical protein